MLRIVLRFTCLLVVTSKNTTQPEAKATIACLNKMGIVSFLVTGDNARTAGAIASQVLLAPFCILELNFVEQVGITHVFAEVLPSQKAQKVADIKVS